MCYTDAGAGPHDGELVVVGEQNVVHACSRQEAPDDVRHPVVELVAEDRRAVVARDTDAVCRGWIVGPGNTAIQRFRETIMGLSVSDLP